MTISMSLSLLLLLCHYILNVNVVRCDDDYYLMSRVQGQYNGGTDILFGRSVSVGDGYAVGAADDGFYIFRLNSTDETWQQTQSIRSSNSDVTTFGRAASIWKDHMILCTKLNTVIILKLNETDGMWYKLPVFTNNDWNETAARLMDVDITDGHAIVGDDYTSVASYRSGAGFIFVQSVDEEGNEIWIQNQTLEANDPGSFSWFGSTVSIGDKCAIIGAYSDEAAYIYEIDNNYIWKQSIKLEVSDSKFGNSVSINQACDLAIVGAGAVYDASKVGSAYIYEKLDNGSWVLMEVLIPKHNNTLSFGASVAIYHETVVIGAPETSSDVYVVGVGYVYELEYNYSGNGYSWINTGYFTIYEHDGVAYDRFGTSADIFKDYVIVGAMGGPHAYIYGRTSSACDEEIQTKDTNLLCKFLSSLDDTLPDITRGDVFNSINYCNDGSALGKYFKCLNESDTSIITHIYLNGTFNSVINDKAWSTFQESLIKLLKRGNVVLLDLSDNGIYGQVSDSDWEGFGLVQYLSLANNEFIGAVSMTSMAQFYNDNGNKSRVIELDLSHNEFDRQPIEWIAFSRMEYLETINLSFNQFNERINITYLRNCTNLKYVNIEYNAFSSIVDINMDLNEDFGKGDSIIPSLETFIINDNNIQMRFDMAFFVKNKNLVEFFCSNNKLFNTNEWILNEIPNNLKVFECFNNSDNLGELIWYPSPTLRYDLEYLDLSGSNLNGNVSTSVLAPENGFNKLIVVDLSFNDELSIEINLEYLENINNLLYLNIKGTNTNGRADFRYLTNNITISMDTSVRCVDAVCKGRSGGKIYAIERNNDTCTGREGCLATCQCGTASQAGYAASIDETITDVYFYGLIGFVGFLLLLVIIGKVYALGYIPCSETISNMLGCKTADNFAYIQFATFVFQVWDFGSDVILCYSIWYRFYQYSISSPDQEAIYLRYLVLCASFVFVPWIVNLTFLMKTKFSWQNKDWGTDHELGYEASNVNVDHDENKSIIGNSNNKHVNALNQSSFKTNKWLSDNATILVLLCMISGSLTASINVVNSQLFGLDYFDMGLPKYKQDQTARHRLWLTIMFENIPQIVISTSYAIQLVGFDTTVLAALVSSIVSVILAILSALLEFPKHYYIYQVDIKLDTSSTTANPKILHSLGMTVQMSTAICKAMEKNQNFLFVENVYFDGNDYACFNVVCNEPITPDHDYGKEDSSGYGNNDARSVLSNDYQTRMASVSATHDSRASVNVAGAGNYTLDKKRCRKIMDGLYKDEWIKIKCESLSLQFVMYKCVKLRCSCCNSGKNTKQMQDIQNTAAFTQMNNNGVEARTSMQSDDESDYKFNGDNYHYESDQAPDLARVP